MFLSREEKMGDCPVMRKDVGHRNILSMFEKVFLAQPVLR